jgi:AcrR family transcriptional regulator
MDQKLLAVAVELLAEEGWTALSLDRIAERAGVSRATVWRHGLTRASVEAVLRERLAHDYRDALWKPLTMNGSGRERLTAALAALCDVAERNLPLLAHTDEAFHGPALDAAGIQLDYFGPWLRILEAGAADGSLDVVDDQERFVVALTNLVLLTYVHLRALHGEYGWGPGRRRITCSVWLPTATFPERGIGQPNAE